MKRKTLITIPLIMATVVTALWATDALTIGPSGAVSINGNLTVDGVIHDAYGQVMPTGSIIAFAGATPPSGWLLCDGSEISQTEYEALYQVIQDTWGTAGDPTKFKLPDLRGAFLRGTGSHGSEIMDNGQPFAGPPVGAYQGDQLQQHSHALSFRSADGNNRYQPNRSSATTVYSGGTGGVSGARSGSETRPFAAGVNYIIKL